MSPLYRTVAAIAALATLTACGDDRSVNPVVDVAIVPANTLSTASTITAHYDLSVGQTVRIVPKTTTRINRARWSTTSSAVASVSSSGTVTARSAGLAIITLSGSGVLESYEVAVVSPTVTSFSLQPKTGVTLNAGQTQQYATNTTWSDGQARSATVTYTATGGTISSTGLFTAGNVAGTFMVIATCSCTTPAIADTALVSVTVPQLTSLAVSPKTVSVTAGATQQFAVSAQWNTGATTVPPVTWSATGGSVSATGLYTAPTAAGTYRVIVAHTGGTVRDTAVVTVGGASNPAEISACPNAPSNHTTHSDFTFSSIDPPAGWSAWGDDRTLSNETGPYRSTSLAFRHEAGKSAGGVGGMITTPLDNIAPKRIYSCIIFRQSANYVQHPVGTKFIYTPQAGTATRPIMLIMAPTVNSSNPLPGGRFKWVLAMQTSDTQKLYSENIAPGEMEPGVWYRFEFLTEMNTPGAKDGKVTWWTSSWNGTTWSSPVLNARHTNVLIAEAGLPGYWSRWEYNFYYGGASMNTLPADQFISVNRSFLSWAP